MKMKVCFQMQAGQGLGHPLWTSFRCLPPLPAWENEPEADVWKQTWDGGGPLSRQREGLLGVCLRCRPGPSTRLSPPPLCLHRGLESPLGCAVFSAAHVTVVSSSSVSVPVVGVSWACPGWCVNRHPCPRCPLATYAGVLGLGFR